MVEIYGEKSQASGLEIKTSEGYLIKVYMK